MDFYWRARRKFSGEITTDNTFVSKAYVQDISYTIFCNNDYLGTTVFTIISDHVVYDRVFVDFHKY